MKDLSDYSEFYNILELVFVLSHGHADIRKIKDNLLCNETNLNTYTIPSKMLESVQLSRKKYEVYLQENKS